MRTEQPSKCFVPLQKLKARLAPENIFKPTSYSLLTVPRRLFCGGFLLPVYGVRLSFVDVSPYLCSYHFKSVWVDEWPSFGFGLNSLLQLPASVNLATTNRRVVVAARYVMVSAEIESTFENLLALM